MEADRACMFPARSVKRAMETSSPIRCGASVRTQTFQCLPGSNEKHPPKCPRMDGAAHRALSLLLDVVDVGCVPCVVSAWLRDDEPSRKRQQRELCSRDFWGQLLHHM
jgi:hypothetical protein